MLDIITALRVPIWVLNFCGGCTRRVINRGIVIPAMINLGENVLQCTRCAQKWTTIESAAEFLQSDKRVAKAFLGVEWDLIPEGKTRAELGAIVIAHRARSTSPKS